MSWKIITQEEQQKPKSKIKAVIWAVFWLVAAWLTLFAAFQSGECKIENKFCLEEINFVVDEVENTTDAVLDF